MSRSAEVEYTVVIPARYDSSRLPGKPLELIDDLPMIQHVYQQAQKSSAARVIVATDDQRIINAVQGFGGECCKTSSEHESGTDRIQEVVEFLGLPDDHIVVNVQGDEPLIPPEVIDQVAQNLSRMEEASVATLCEKIEAVDEFTDPNAVKVVMDKNGFALYFSRASIPWPRDTFATTKAILPMQPVFARHIGIYAYRVGLLNEFKGWPVAMLEELECLEQLRIMWNGHRIHVAQASAVVPSGVDTPDDLARIRSVFED